MTDQCTEDVASRERLRRRLEQTTRRVHPKEMTTMKYDKNTADGPGETRFPSSISEHNCKETQS